jgi:hypothetical protein
MTSVDTVRNFGKASEISEGESAKPLLVLRIKNVKVADGGHPKFREA